MSDWLKEGTAHRTPVQRTPVIHLLVQENGDLHMWCTGGKGREDNPYGNRLCRECRDLARDGVKDGMIDSAEVSRWLSDDEEPTS